MLTCALTAEKHNILVMHNRDDESEFTAVNSHLKKHLFEYNYDKQIQSACLFFVIHKVLLVRSKKLVAAFYAVNWSEKNITV